MTRDVSCPACGLRVGCRRPLSPMKSPLSSLIPAVALAAALLVPCVQAVESHSVQQLADQAKALPWKTAVTKGEKGPQYGAPYVLSVTNSSSAALKIDAVVAQSVMGHNRPKNVERAGPNLQPGQTWKLDYLAAVD